MATWKLRRATQSGTSFGTLYAALILHRIGNNHPTAGVKRDPVITVTVYLSRNLHEQVAASADTYTPAEARGRSALRLWELGGVPRPQLRTAVLRSRLSVFFCKWAAARTKRRPLPSCLRLDGAEGATPGSSA
jgi:hypothetical protein